MPQYGPAALTRGIEQEMNRVPERYSLTSPRPIISTVKQDYFSCQHWQQFPKMESEKH